MLFSAWSEVVAGVPTRWHQSRFGGMLVLLVAPPGSHEVPPIISQQLEHLANLHRNNIGPNVPGGKPGAGLARSPGLLDCG